MSVAWRNSIFIKQKASFIGYQIIETTEILTLNSIADNNIQRFSFSKNELVGSLIFCFRLTNEIHNAPAGARLLTFGKFAGYHKHFPR
jgi:hypothetical protein